MIEVTARLVRELRTATGAPLMKCKTALVEANGDLDQAERILRRIGNVETPTSVSVGKQGYIAVYAHSGNQIVSLVELGCETDFVARSDEFRAVASELAMQVVGTSPVALSPSDLPESVRDEELQIARVQADTDPKTAGKSADLRERIAQDKADKILSERCLLTQVSIRDQTVTVGSLLDGLRLQVREGVHVRRFARWRVGEALDEK